MGEAAQHLHQYEQHRPEESILYQAVAAHLETFVEQRRCEGHHLPPRVLKELRGYLRCGILHYGFTRLVCPTCAFERAVAFSCKGRGFCPSCAGKRMAETTAHLIDHVLPWAPYRQWVLSLPMPLRYWCATNAKLLSRVITIATRAIGAFLACKAKQSGVATPLPGLITFIQRTGSALNLNVHLHILALDGVYAASGREGDRPRFQPLAPPTDEDIATVVTSIAKKTITMLRRRGYISDDPGHVAMPQIDPMFADFPAAAEALASSIKGMIAFGPRAGQYVRRISPGFGYEEDAPLVQGVKCASVHGFNLHAQVHTGAHQRQRLEQLVKYMSRPPLTLDRLSATANGELLYTLKRAWSDGTTAVLLSPSELLEKLVAMIPPARSHLVRHHGIFSSHSKVRPLVVVDPMARKGFNPETVDKTKVKNHHWAKMLARMFKIDVGTCPHCGTDMEIRAAVHDPAEISRYLRHLGLSTHPPPVAKPSAYQPELDFGANNQAEQNHWPNQAEQNHWPD